MNKIGKIASELLASVITCLLATVCAAQGDAGQANSSSNESGYIEEIIVRAQKRNKRLQDVPIAVTALSAQMIRELGLINVHRLTELNPSVSFDVAQSFQNSSLKIRGIGTVGNGRSFEGAVGVFVDGVYRPRSAMILSDLLDIGQIEILRGPQSTLFGKNTVAGTISLSSAAANLDEFSGQAELRVGNFDARYLSAAVNLPVSDTVAVRLAGVFNESDGYFENPDSNDQYDTTSRSGFKAQLLYEPSDKVQLTLIGDYTNSDANCCWAAAIAANGPTAPLIDTYGSINGLTFVAAPAAERDRAASLNALPTEKIEDSGLTALLKWDIGKLELNSITGIRNWTHKQINADTDFSPANILILDEPTEIRNVSQEFTLSIPFDSADLLLGIYYFREDFESVRSVQTASDADNYLNALVSAGQGAVACLPPVVAADCLFPPGIGALLPDGELTRESYRQDSETYAVFSHVTVDLTETLSIIAGLRYSDESKDGGVDNQFWYDSAIVRAVLAAAGIPDDGTPRNGLDLIGTVYSPSFTASINDQVTTGLLSLQYATSDDVMVYASYHRGYKAGGVNLFREGAITSTTYNPELADGLEAGLKADYWNGKARTNVAVFRTDFSDLQINFFTGLEFRTENTGEAISQGVEIENQLQITDRFRWDLAVTWLDSEFGNLNNPPIDYLSGRATPRAPTWAAVTNLAYEIPLPSGRNIFARGLASYTGSHYVGSDVATEEKVGGYTIVDLDIGILGKDRRWEATLWCQNCADQSYRTIFFNSVFQPGSQSSYLNTPRLYGVRFRAFF